MATSQPSDIDMLFLVLMGMIVFLMQCGFAFMEAGSVRSKNASSILTKNLLNTFTAAVSYWLLGFPFAFSDGGSFIGWNNWASAGLGDSQLAGWFFQCMLAATTATIVSGALAERCQLVAYFLYTFFITAFVYPLVTRWAWYEDGWLRKGQVYDLGGNATSVSVGYEDFAGSGVVHVVGGVAACVGAAMLGPRQGRVHSHSGGSGMPGHSAPLVCLGGFLLVLGHLAVTAGCQLTISRPGDGQVVSLAVVNVVISGATAALSSQVVYRLTRLPCTEAKSDALNTFNGALAGMVAMAAGCDVIRPWGAAIVGGVAGLVFRLFAWLAGKLVDDPVDAVAVHLGGGVWGAFSVALLKDTPTSRGFLPLLFAWDWDRGAGLLLAWQLTGVMALIGWTLTVTGVMFGVLSRCKLLRVSSDVEHRGLDAVTSGCPAYSPDSSGHVMSNGGPQMQDMGCANGGFISAWETDVTPEMQEKQRAPENPEMTERRPVSPGDVEATLQGLEDILQKAHQDTEEGVASTGDETPEKRVVVESTTL